MIGSFPYPLYAVFFLRRLSQHPLNISSVDAPAGGEGDDNPTSKFKTWRTPYSANSNILPSFLFFLREIEGVSNSTKKKRGRKKKIKKYAGVTFFIFPPWFRNKKKVNFVSRKYSTLRLFQQTLGALFLLVYDIVCSVECLLYVYWICLSVLVRYIVFVFWWHTLSL